MKCKTLACLSSLLLLACSHTDALIISGHSLNVIGEGFVETAEAMNKAALKGDISSDKYFKWAEFGTKFQATYPAAVHLWRMSVILSDKELQEKSAQLLMVLIPELLQFAQEIGVTIMVLK